MYKLYHYWFGWDYIYWTNSASEGISRVRILPSGKVYCWRYWRIMDVIEEPGQVIWLTCKPEKYFASTDK